MKPLTAGEARFRIHGPDPSRDGLVSASLFANKLGVLVRALNEADRQLNGEHTHDYKISELESSSPTVTLKEVVKPAYEGMIPVKSGIVGFEDCAESIIYGNRKRALNYGSCANHINSLAGGARKTYGYAEVWTSKDHITRVDAFMREQASAILHPEAVRPSKEDRTWYKGIIDATFDGAIKAVDLRGELPEIKLILTAGAKELNCVCRAENMRAIKENLDARVRVYGRAIYDGKSGLPRRIEVREIEPVQLGVDFKRWRGSFEPFQPPDWDSDEA